MRVTLHDICKKTGLSTATVSRVLNNSPLVTEKTRLRVQEVMKELHYHPLSAARSLAGQCTNTLGVISPYIGTGFFTELLLGIDSEAIQKNYHIMTAFAHGVIDEEQLIERFLMERWVDALIILNLDIPGEFLSSLPESNIPIISVDTPALEYGLPSVTVDNKHGGHVMMSHLLERGFRDIIIFAGPKENHDSRDRLEGCLNAATEVGFELQNDRIISGDFIVESGRQLMREFLDSNRPLPEVILSLNDAMAMGAMTELRKDGLMVPKDVAMTGYDDSELASLIGLTTVNIPFIDMGREAAKLAIAALKGDNSTPHVVMPTKLVIRESCQKL